MQRISTLILSIALLAACMTDHMGEMSLLPEVLKVPVSAGAFEGAVAEDTDPAPHVVEVSLEARIAEVEWAPGHSARMWTYNGLLPGPQIDAHVGDTVRVHFKNSLPEATTIHWHGVRVPAAMDGVPAVQSPVQPGEEFTYEFVVPDQGTFWYHPHVRSDVQVERGLYGAFVVHGDDEPETTTDRTVVLDDLLVDSDWNIADFDSTMAAMMGRQGNLILANGRAHPVAPMVRGGLHRFRFINSANARYFRLALPGHHLVQIGSDGGMLTGPQEIESLLLVPGERADVLVVGSGAAGEATEWTTLSYDRGHGSGSLRAATVFQSKNNDEAPMPTPSIPNTLATIDTLPAATVQRELKLEESISMASGGGMHGGGHSSGDHSTTMGMVFSFNGKVYPDGEHVSAKLGAVEDWSLVNTTVMDHPFHLHGFRFQVASVDGTKPAFAAWHDTINVPANQTVVMRVKLEDHPGMWMFHCHILEHAERGMMGELEVAQP